MPVFDGRELSRFAKMEAKSNGPGECQGWISVSVHGKRVIDGMVGTLLGRAERSGPEAARWRAKGAELDGASADQAIMDPAVM